MVGWCVGRRAPHPSPRPRHTYSRGSLRKNIKYTNKLKTRRIGPKRKRGQQKNNEFERKDAFVGSTSRVRESTRGREEGVSKFD